MSELHENYMQTIREFRLPAYNEIPDVGLYLEQVTKYVSEYLAPMCSVSITGSMISNYVKKKLVKNPVKKQYGREQIAVILFIALAKNAISLEEIQQLLQLSEQTYTVKESYEYLSRELKNALFDVYELEREESVPGRPAMEKTLLKNILITVAHKEYLDHSFRMLMQKEGV